MKQGKIKTFLRSSSGAIVSALVIYGGLLFVFSLLSTMLLFTLGDPTGYIRVFSLASFLLTGSIGALILGRLYGKDSFLLITLGAVLFLLLLLFIGVIGSGGAIKLTVLMNDLCFLFIALFCGALGSRGSGRKKKKRMKRHR